VYSNNIPLLFPQHGPGRKHTRKINLEEWQEDIVKEHPKAIIKGLLDSDGCRFIATLGKKKYLRFQFTNKSEDIKDIFCKVCDTLNIGYWRKVGYKNINIQRKQSVDIVDKFYEPKT